MVLRRDRLLDSYNYTPDFPWERVIAVALGPQYMKNLPAEPFPLPIGLPLPVPLASPA